MNRVRRAVLLVGVVGLVGVAERPALGIDFGLGLFKRRQAKADAPVVSKAKQLAEVLRTDPDESKRKDAANEMKSLDPRNNPEVIPGLVASVQKDPSPAVRIEAVRVLGDLKPVSEPAGLALEAAVKADPDPKVREAIAAALWQYHLNGYRTPDSGSPLSTMTERAGDKRAVPKTEGFAPIRNTVGRISAPLLSVEPPLAPAKPKFPALPPAPTVAPVPVPAPSLVPQDLPPGAPRPMPTTRPVEAAPVSRVKPTPTVGGLPPLTIPQVEVPPS